MARESRPHHHHHHHQQRQQQQHHHHCEAHVHRFTRRYSGQPNTRTVSGVARTLHRSARWVVKFKPTVACFVEVTLARRCCTSDVETKQGVTKCEQHTLHTRHPSQLCFLRTASASCRNTFRFDSVLCRREQFASRAPLNKGKESCKRSPSESLK